MAGRMEAEDDFGTGSVVNSKGVGCRSELVRRSRPSGSFGGSKHTATKGNEGLGE